MTSTIEPPKAIVSPPISPLKPGHVALIWLAAGYWLLNGTAHLLQLVPALPVLTNLPDVMLLAVAIAALIGVLSLWGGAMFLRRKKRAIPVLVSVFAIMAIWFLIRLIWVPVSNTPLSAIIEGALACASMGYALLLAKWGRLQ